MALAGAMAGTAADFTAAQLTRFDRLVQQAVEGKHPGTDLSRLSKVANAHGIDEFFQRSQGRSIAALRGRATQPAIAAVAATPDTALMLRVFAIAKTGQFAGDATTPSLDRFNKIESRNFKVQTTYGSLIDGYVPVGKPRTVKRDVEVIDWDAATAHVHQHLADILDLVGKGRDETSQQITRLADRGTSAPGYADKYHALEQIQETTHPFRSWFARTFD